MYAYDKCDLQRVQPLKWNIAFVLLHTFACSICGYWSSSRLRDGAVFSRWCLRTSRSISDEFGGERWDTCYRPSCPCSSWASCLRWCRHILLCDWTVSLFFIRLPSFEKTEFFSNFRVNHPFKIRTKYAFKNIIPISASLEGSSETVSSLLRKLFMALNAYRNRNA